MEVKKFRYKQLETQIKNTIKLLGLGLDRLHKHCTNIRRLSGLKDRQELHKEQINASHTIQQIDANSKEIQRLRRQVYEEDIPQFDLRVEEIKEKSVTCVEEFFSLIKGETTGVDTMQTTKKSKVVAVAHGTGDIDWDDLTSDSSMSTPSTSRLSHNIPELHLSEGRPFSDNRNGQIRHPVNNGRGTATAVRHSIGDVSSPSTSVHSPSSRLPQNVPDRRPVPRSTSSSHRNLIGGVRGHSDLLEDQVENRNQVPVLETDEEWVEVPPLLQVQTQQRTPPDNTDAALTWESQRDEIQQLNELVHMFSDKVDESQEQVDSISDNVSNAQVHVSKGTSLLGKASKYKAAMYPVIGAAVGTLVGGPIGFVAGLKIGGLAAVSGSAIGFAGGRYLKKRQVKSVDVELTKLSKENQVPEIIDLQANGQNPQDRRKERNDKSSSNPFK